MAEKRTCELCKEALEERPAIHDSILFEKNELLKSRIEIKKLRASVLSWKEAWFHLREIIGDLWFSHPAIDDDEERAYYQNQQKGKIKL